MNLISIENAKPGMTVARNIYGEDRAVLIAEGVVLKPGYIERLVAQGICCLYVRDEVDDLAIVPNRQRTKADTLTQVEKVLTSPKFTATFSLEHVEQDVTEIVTGVLEREDTLERLGDVRHQADYTFSHSVNTCVLSLLIGHALGYERPQLELLGEGALLHDIGKSRLPETITHKCGRLNAAELAEYQQHTFTGFKILHEELGISVTAALIALQHHENFDGSGYPWQLKGEDILEMARIVAVADTYDALTSDQIYRRGIPPHEAVEQIIRAKGAAFDPQIVDAFVQNIASYPPDSFVTLSDGRRGIVVKAVRENPLRPVVRLCDESGQPGPELVDLAEEKSIYIVNIGK